MSEKRPTENPVRIEFAELRAGLEEVSALARGSHRLELVYHGDQQGLAMHRREGAPVLEVANVDFDID